MQKAFLILPVALILLNLTAIGQHQKFVKKNRGYSFSGINNHFFDPIQGINSHTIDRYLSIDNQAALVPFYLQRNSYSGPITAQNPSIRQYSYFSPRTDWGIICQKEWEVEKATGIPFRFRLGSVEYVDKLEAKTK